MMYRRSLSWMMWEVSTATISLRRWIASAVFPAAEVLVDVSMVLVLCGGCAKGDWVWEFSHFVAGYSDD